MAETLTEKPAVPSDITLSAILVDIHFHPEKNVIASGSIDGQVYLHSYSTVESNHELMVLKHHKKSCRAVNFSPDGQKLYTASKDKSLYVIDMNEGSVQRALKDAHPASVYSLCVVDNNIIASGDDDGYVKLWDMREPNSVMELHESEEFISDMEMADKSQTLLATSGEGTLTAYDIRKHNMKTQSETFDTEFLSLATLQRHRKVVCGTGEGVLNIFNMWQWGYISDRFPGHPNSVDCMVPLSDTVIATGSMDGIIRAVHIVPNRFLGVVGQHEDFPVENLSLSHCGTYLASCSHDQCIKFWDVKDLDSITVDASEKPEKSAKTKKIKPENRTTDNFFADLGGETSGAQNDKDGDDEEDSGDNESDDYHASDLDSDED